MRECGALKFEPVVATKRDRRKKGFYAGIRRNSDGTYKFDFICYGDRTLAMSAARNWAEHENKNAESDSPA